MPDTPIDQSDHIPSIRLRVPTGTVPIPPAGFGQLHSPSPGVLALRLPDGSVVEVGPATGGGGSGPTLLGPYSVTFADTDIGNGAAAGHFLAALDAGTLVIAAWAIVTTAFAQTGGVSLEDINVVAGDPAGDWDVAYAGAANIAHYAPGSGVSRENDPRVGQPPLHRVIRLNTAGSLRAWVGTDGTLTAGAADIYAYVRMPT